MFDDEIQYVFLGQGDVLIFDSIDILSKDGYKGYYSFEWAEFMIPMKSKRIPEISSMA